MRYFLFLRLFFTIWIVYIFHFRPLASTSERYVLLTMSLVEHGTIALDALVKSSQYYWDIYQIDRITANGHYYICVNPGLSFLAVPFWAIVNFIYKKLPDGSLLDNDSIHYFLAHFISFTFTTGLFGALSSWLIAVFIYQRTRQKWRGLLAGLLYAFGSIAFVFSTRQNQNSVTAFITILVFVLLFEPLILSIKSQILQLFLVGFLLGMGLFVDVTIAPFFVVTFFVLVLKKVNLLVNIRYLLMGAFIPIISLFSYQCFAFGKPFLSASMIFVQQHPKPDSTTQIMGIDVYSLFEYLVSLKAGMFVYMPYAILAVWYIIRHFKENKLLERLEKNAIILNFLLYFLLIGLLPSPYLYSLFGPRYLLPVIPFICIIFALYVGWKELNIAVALTALSFFTNTAGAQMGIDTNNIIVIVATYIIKGPWLPVLNWIESDLKKVSGYSPDVIVPYGLLFFLMVCLVAIWLPYILFNYVYKSKNLDSTVPQSLIDR
jgi:hypothetical protein